MPMHGNKLLIWREKEGRGGGGGEEEEEEYDDDDEEEEEEEEERRGFLTYFSKCFVI
jgi:hypothetical protein